MLETKFPPFDELERDGNGRIIFPEGYPVDQLPTDEHGLIAIPQGYPLWHEATELNRERLGELLSGKVNKGDVPEEIDLESILASQREHDRDPEAHEGRIRELEEQVARYEEAMTAWQERQDADIRLMNDMLEIDLEEKELFAFDQLGKIRLIQGVYNADMKRLEC